MKGIDYYGRYIQYGAKCLAFPALSPYPLELPLLAWYFISPIKKSTIRQCSNCNWIKISTLIVASEVADRSCQVGGSPILRLTNSGAKTGSFISELPVMSFSLYVTDTMILL